LDLQRRLTQDAYTSLGAKAPPQSGLGIRLTARPATKGKLEKAFEGSVKAVEARNNGGPKAAP